MDVALLNGRGSRQTRPCLHQLAVLVLGQRNYVIRTSTLDASSVCNTVDDADTSHNLISNINTSTTLRIRFYDVLRGTGIRLRLVHPSDIHGC